MVPESHHWINKSIVSFIFLVFVVDVDWSFFAFMRETFDPSPAPPSSLLLDRAGQYASRRATVLINIYSN